jgi:hypothetical protein
LVLCVARSLNVISVTLGFDICETKSRHD